MNNEPSRSGLRCNRRQWLLQAGLAVPGFASPRLASRRPPTVAFRTVVTYLFSIARRRSADRWRRHGMQLRPEADADELEALPAPAQTWPHSRAETEAIGAAIMGAVDALPPAQREVFLLRAETDLTLDEIAQVTGTTRIQGSQTGSARSGDSMHPQFSVGIRHTVTFHVNPRQVRHVRLDLRESTPAFVAQLYPKLVDVTVGRAQKIESIARY